MGKSRLVYEVIHSHRTQGWRVLESAAVSYGCLLYTSDAAAIYSV